MRSDDDDDDEYKIQQDIIIKKGMASCQVSLSLFKKESWDSTSKFSYVKSNIFIVNLAYVSHLVTFFP